MNGTETIEEIDALLEQAWSVDPGAGYLYWTGSDEELRKSLERMGHIFTDDEWAKWLTEAGGEEGFRHLG